MGLLRFGFFLTVVLVLLFLAMVLGDRGSWYLAWVLGTAMMVLFAAGAAIWLDHQESHAEVRDSDHPDASRS